MIESIPEFYRRIGEHNFSVADYSKEKPYFSVQPCRCRIGHTSFSYREFYKVTLVLGEGKLIDAIFGEYCEKHLIQPVFITDYPVSMSPLTKRHRSNPDLTERFELFVCGKELANAYSELNDPIDQLERFEDQLKQREHGDDEAMYIDMDFVRALEYGMPPTSGMGMGIDRLTMFMTNSPTIQDVLFFPQMRPKKAQGQDAGKKEE